MHERRIGRPFKLGNEIGDLLIEMVCRGFDFIGIGKTLWHSVDVFSGNGADAIFNFKGLANPAAIFPIDKFLAQSESPDAVRFDWYIGRYLCECQQNCPRLSLKLIRKFDHLLKFCLKCPKSPLNGHLDYPVSRQFRTLRLKGR